MVRLTLQRAMSWSVLSLALAGPAWAQQAPTGSWEDETSGGTFYEGAAATDGTYMYLIGGYQYGTNPQNGFDWAVCTRYDPANNAWTTIAQMPYWHNWHNAAEYYDGRIFSLGHGDIPGSIFAYTISTNTWATLSATLTGNRYYAAAARLGSKIYVAGGFGNGNNSNLCDEFDPATDTITPRASMPGATVHHCMAAVASLGKAYVMGGFFYAGGGYNGYPQSACYEFTPPSAGNPNGSWTTRAPMTINSSLAPRSLQPAAFTLNNRVYVAGGHTGSSPFNGVPVLTLLEYNPFTNSWAQRANLATYHFNTAGVAISGYGYVYGGSYDIWSHEKYTPPDFGAPPAAPAGVTQIGSRSESSFQAQADATQFDGWTNEQIAFSADVTDADAGQLVRLRVRVKPAGAAAWTNLDSGLRDQGTITLAFQIPTPGGYDWEYRIEDDLDNCYPTPYGTWAPAFNNANSPDFRSDQVPPSAPVGIGPSGFDVQSPEPTGGPVTFSWTASTDDGPVASIEYEIQAARDGGFNDIEAQFFSAPGASETTAPLAPSDAPKFWRVRARDVGANFSDWSPPLSYRLVHDGGGSHGGRCGQSAGPASASGAAAPLFGLALLLFAGRRRRAVSLDPGRRPW